MGAQFTVETVVTVSTDILADVLSLPNNQGKPLQQVLDEGAEAFRVDIEDSFEDLPTGLAAVVRTVSAVEV
jgi:hypothetical protein